MVIRYVFFIVSVLCYSPCFNVCQASAIDGLRGAVAPVFTPIKDDGSINYDVIPIYVNFLAKQGIKTIMVGGVDGEFNAFSLDERRDILLAFLEAAKPLNVKVIAHVGKGPLPGVMALADYAETFYADAILVLPEVSTKPKSIEDVVAYLKAVASAASSLPLIYYHLPNLTAVNINLREFYALASATIPSFGGLLTNILNAAEVQDLVTDDQIIFVTDYLIAPIVGLGYRSSTGVITNIFPRTVVNILKAMQAGDVSTAVALQKQITKAVHAIEEGGDYTVAMKVAMELVTGIPVGRARFPQLTLKPNAYEIIANNLSKLGVPIISHAQSTKMYPEKKPLAPIAGRAGASTGTTVTSVGVPVNSVSVPIITVNVPVAALTAASDVSSNLV